MVHDTRIGEMRTKTLTASLGLTLALGICVPVRADDGGARDRAMFSGHRAGDGPGFVVP